MLQIFLFCYFETELAALLFTCLFAVMEDQDTKRMAMWLSYVVLDCVMPYIHDSKDRDVVL